MILQLLNYYFHFQQERLFCREEQSTRRIENFVKDGDLYKERMESSDTSNSYNMTLMDGSQKKDTGMKREYFLIIPTMYFSDTLSIFDDV